MPMGIQESFRVVRGLLGFLWGQCNGRGPHLELRRERVFLSCFDMDLGVSVVSNMESGLDLC